MYFLLLLDTKLIRCKRWASLYYHEKISPVQDPSRGIDGWIIVISEDRRFTISRRVSSHPCTPFILRKKKGEKKRKREKEREGHRYCFANSCETSISSTVLPFTTTFRLAGEPFRGLLNAFLDTLLPSRRFGFYTCITSTSRSEIKGRSGKKEERGKFEIKFIIWIVRETRAQILFSSSPPFHYRFCDTRNYDKIRNLDTTMC